MFALLKTGSTLARSDNSACALGTLPHYALNATVMLLNGVSLGVFFLFVSLPIPPMTFARLSQVELVHGRFAMASLLALVLAAPMIKM